MIYILFLLFLLFPTNVFALDSNDIQQEINSLPPTGGTIILQKGEYVLSNPHGSLYTFPN